MSEPAVTITIMFTDLVGSTALANRLGEDQSQALRRAHQRILTGQFERHAGEMIKGTGDGYMVAFASARRAVECAIDIQRAVEHEHAEGRYEDLNVRIGVHTGEPVREHGDLFGTDVNLAARIEAEADGGHTLVSQVTWLLTRATPRVTFSPIGERMLKGFDDPMPLFDVRSAADMVRPKQTRFIGRVEESSQLRESIALACRGHGGVVFVTGDAGVGKTRLVSEMSIVAGDSGMDVLSGSAYDADGLPPFLPIVEALRSHFARNDEPIALNLDDRSYLGKLLPELAPPGASAAPTLGLDPDSERELLFGAINGVFRLMAEHRPVLLTLDDLHWADRSTLLFVRHVAQQITDMPMLVIATYRDAEVDRRHPLRAVLADLARGRLARQVAVHPFGSDDMAMLIQGAIGTQPAPRVLDALKSATEGNAFYTEELVRQLRDQGRDLADPHAEVAGWGIPDGVRQLIARRLARLERDHHRMLSHASVIGKDLTVELVASVTGSDEMSVLDALDRSLEMALLRESDAGFTFAHPLIRETLYEELSAARRRFLHLRVGTALESIYAAQPQAHVAELALHFYNAGRDADPEKTIDYCTRAGAAADELFAYEDAVLHHERALEVFESQAATVDEVRRCELLLRVGDARWKTGDSLSTREAFNLAADSARKANAPDLFARAALGFGSGEQDFVGEDADLVQLLREALRGPSNGATHLRAMVLARLAQALMTSADRDEARAISADAVDVARHAEDTVTLVRALNARHEALLRPDELPERLELASQAVTLVEGSAAFSDKAAAWYAHDWRLTDLLEIGDVESATAELGRLYACAEELRHPHWLGLSKVAATTLALLAGRFDEAERLIEETGEAGRRHAAVSLEFYSDMQLFALRREQHRLEETANIIARWVDGQPNLGRVARLEAVRYAELGDDANARADFEMVAADDFANLPCDNVWLYSLCVLVDVCALLNDTRRAETLYRLLLPYSGRYASLGDVHALGSVARFVAKAAITAGNSTDAERHLAFALEQNERIGARPFVAYGHYDVGCLLLAKQDVRATARLGEALTLAEELKMTALVAKVKAALSH